MTTSPPPKTALGELGEQLTEVAQLECALMLRRKMEYLHNIASASGPAAARRVIEEEIQRLKRQKRELWTINRSLNELVELNVTRFQQLLKERESMKRSEGLAKLPTEVIVRIFMHTVGPPSDLNIFADDLVDTVPDSKQALILSHVSQYFRSVAISTRQLWTIMTRLNPWSFVKLFLKRSGNLPLIVIQRDVPEISMETAIRILNGIYEIVRGHAHRVQVLVWPVGVGDQTFMYTWMASQRTLTFPILRRFQTKCPIIERYRAEDEADNWWADGIPNDAAGRRCPVLVQANIPDTLPKLWLAPSLTTVELRGEVLHEEAVHIERILSALSKLERLVTLTLDLSYEGDYEHVDLIHGTEPHWMNSVQALKIHTRNELSNEALEVFLYWARFPNIKSLDITLCSELDSRRTLMGPDGTCNIITELGQPRHFFDHLHTLTLRRSPTSGFSDSLTHAVWLHPMDHGADEGMWLNMPNLRSLTMQYVVPDNAVWALGGHRADETHILPYLETLRIHDCDYVDAPLLYDVLRLRKTQASPMHLKHLEVKRCKMVAHGSSFGPIHIKRMMGNGASVNMDVYESKQVTTSFNLTV